MAQLETAIDDPSLFIRRDESLCAKLKKEDKLGTQNLADQLIDKMKLEPASIIPRDTVAIISKIGNGKSYFLGLLFCKLFKLFKKKYNVHYVNIMDFIADNDADNAIESIRRLSDDNLETVIVLIDDLEKHSPRFILNFISMLHQLSKEENFLFILAYDFYMIELKLRELYGEGQESEYFFQKYIDYEFYLGENVPEDKIKQIINIKLDNNPEHKRKIEELITQLYIEKELSFSQIIILVKKFNFFIHAITMDIPSYYIALKLITYKLICRNQYDTFLSEHKETNTFSGCAENGRAIESYVTEIDNTIQEIQAEFAGLLPPDEPGLEDIIKQLELCYV